MHFNRQWGEPPTPHSNQPHWKRKYCLRRLCRLVPATTRDGTMKRCRAPAGIRALANIGPLPAPRPGSCCVVCARPSTFQPRSWPAAKHPAAGLPSLARAAGPCARSLPRWLASACAAPIAVCPLRYPRTLLVPRCSRLPPQRPRAVQGTRSARCLLDRCLGSPSLQAPAQCSREQHPLARHASR